MRIQIMKLLEENISIHLLLKMWRTSKALKSSGNEHKEKYQQLWLHKILKYLYVPKYQKVNKK